LTPRRGGFIQHHHAVSDVVELTTAAGPGGKQRLEKLNVGRHNQRRIPILCCQTTLRCFLFRIEVAVVLDHLI